MGRGYLRTGLLVAGVACLVVFFSVVGESRQAGGEYATRWSIGLSVSPWFVWERGPSGFRGGVELMSASWLFAAAAAGAFWWRGRLPSGAASSPLIGSPDAEPGAAPDRRGM